MIWRLQDLYLHKHTVSTEIDDKWVPARPENWKHRSFKQRCKEAWAVYKGTAEAFTWPGGQ